MTQGEHEIIEQLERAIRSQRAVRNKIAMICGMAADLDPCPLQAAIAKIGYEAQLAATLIEGTLKRLTLVERRDQHADG